MEQEQAVKKAKGEGEIESIQKDNKRYYEFPRVPEKGVDVKISLFLGGGISKCPDWQKPIAERLAESCPELVFFNPRRAKFNIEDANDVEPQIRWEHNQLKAADAILFWFPCETLCPITLYELGAWTVQKEKTIFIGVHPDYQRKKDVYEQTRLVRPELKVVEDLDLLAVQVEEWYSKQEK